MPIDPSIALNIRPIQLANPLEQYGQFQQAQAAMTQNRLAALVLGDKQREASDTAQMNMLYKGAIGSDGKLDRNMLLSGAASAGLGSRIPALQKSFLDLDKGQADVAKTQADTMKAQADAITKKLDIAGQAFGHVRANPTLENATAALDYLVSNGIYTPEQGAQYKAQVAADPSKIAALADQAFRSALSAKDQLATYQTRNTGATTDTLAIDPVTGKVTVANTVRNTLSPDTAATVAESRRAHNMEDQRARERLNFDKGQPKGVVVQSDTGPLVVDPRTGTGTPVTVGGKVVPPKGSGQAAKDAQSVIGLLDLAEPLLDTATHSLVGAGYDRAAGALGFSTEGAQAAAQLKALEGALVAKQPKMSGPQSDKDVLLYRQMAGQIGDASIPIETRRAAIKTVRALNEKYASQGGAAPAPAAAAPQSKGLPAGWSVEVH